MEKLKKFLKVKDNVDLDELLKFGFKKAKMYGETAYIIEEEKYDLDEDDNEVIINDNISEETELSERDADEIANNILISSKDRILFIEIMNNDCSFHSEGSEVNMIANIVFKLSQAGILEIKEN